MLWQSNAGNAGKDSRGHFTQRGGGGGAVRHRLRREGLRPSRGQCGHPDVGGGVPPRLSRERTGGMGRGTAESDTKAGRREKPDLVASETSETVGRAKSR